MKNILLVLIRIYWILIPKQKRRQCIFRTSCSKHVYNTATNEGFIKGLKALRYRVNNCRAGFNIVENINDGSKIMILPNHYMIPENEIAERLIHKDNL